MGERLDTGQPGKITAWEENDRWRAKRLLRQPDGTTTTLRVSGNTRIAAIEKLRNLTKKHVNHATYTVNETFNQWTQHKTCSKQVKPQTVERYVADYKRTIEPVIGNTDITRISTPQLQQLLDQIEATCSVGAARRARVVLTQMFQYAAARGYCKPHIADATDKIRTVRKPVEVLDATQIQQVVDLVYAYTLDPFHDGPGRNQTIPAVIELIAGTGVRVGEALALQWRDIDFVAGTVRVSGTQAFVKGKTIRQESGKTDMARRVVQARPSAMRALGALPGERHPEGFVFATKYGTMITEANLRRTLRAALRGTYFGGWVTPHTFRKSVATLIAADLGVDAAAKQLGHKVATITETYYVARGQAGPDLGGGVLFGDAKAWWGN